MAGEKILIVDDDEDILLIVQNDPGSAGYLLAQSRAMARMGSTLRCSSAGLSCLRSLMPELSAGKSARPEELLRDAPDPDRDADRQNEIRDLITGMQVGGPTIT